MNLNRNRARTGKRRLQFSIRTLLILTTIVGPILGLYGPAAVDKLREFYADKQATAQVPTPQTQQLMIQNRLRNQKLSIRIAQFRQQLANIRSGKTTSLSKTEQIELGMRADLWERELQRVE
ncbi:hypothetical protein CA13_65670 [Planctomycetes bacterium CA13]|uniref:Uncharacterized protein n=1 Tax=Novipirellula herctigrandis TaxID=2527986 RepID=A0A5C5ZD51_9BACT|nr:hypothetical protein CA13_65670 [Planctomycetes bacterium CA13]